MESTYGARRDAVPPHKDGVPVRRTNRVYAFWVVLAGGAWGSPLTVLLPDGREAIALFSGEEEARMFCRSRGDEGANSTIGRTTAGGVLSLLHCPWCAAKHVALDPFPETLLGERRLLGLLTLDGAGFARRFAGVGSEPSAPRAPWEGPGALPSAASPPTR